MCPPDQRSARHRSERLKSPMEGLRSETATYTPDDANPGTSGASNFYRALELTARQYAFGVGPLCTAVCAPAVWLAAATWSDWHPACRAPAVPATARRRWFPKASPLPAPALPTGPVARVADNLGDEQDAGPAGPSRAGGQYGLEATASGGPLATDYPPGSPVVPSTVSRTHIGKDFHGVDFTALTRSRRRAEANTAGGFHSTNRQHAACSCSGHLG
jgi:hypothetical protein